MAEKVERTKKASTLPPDYVSLAQLREKWLQKQQQKEMDTKPNDGIVETGFTDGNVETQQSQMENKKKKKKWKSKRKKKQPLIDEKVENCQNDEFEIEVGMKNECGRMEIVPKNSTGETSGVHLKNGVANGTKVYRVKLVDETKGNNNGYNKWGNRKRVGGNRYGNSEVEIHDESIKDLEEMSKSEVIQVVTKLDGLKVKDIDGFQRKDDSVVGLGLNNEKLVENGAKDDEKVEARNEVGRYWNRSGNIGRKFGCRPDFGDRRLGSKRTVVGNRLEKSEVEIHDESSKGDEKGKDSENMSKSEVLEVGVKVDGLKVIDSNGTKGKDRSVVGVGLNDDQIVGNGNRAKDDENGEAGNGFGKYRNGSGNAGRKFGRAGFSDRRWGNKRTVGGNRLKKSEVEIHDESSKGDEKGKDSEEMSKSEVVEVGVKVDGLKVIDGNGTKGKDSSVVGVGLNDDDQIVRNENRAKDEEIGEAGNGFGKYRNGSGNAGRKFGRAGFSDRRSGNAVGNRNNAGSGRLGGGMMNQRDNGKVWVKKEDK